MRNISFALTMPQFRDRSKTVTRRLGWADLKPGELLQGVEKCQGLKRGQKGTKLGIIRVKSVLREKLNAITPEDVEKEGFGNMSPGAFVAMFCKSHQSCQPKTTVTRIEFEYVDEKEKS